MYNKIGDIGAQYLADMLKKNVVAYFVNIFYFLLTFNFSFRHLLHLILNQIRLEMLEHNT
jgi:hypothetical protein